jgi:hypothetical protein
MMLDADYLLFDDFASLGLLHGKAPKIGPGGQTWQEKNFATTDPVNGTTVTSPGLSVVTANGMTSTLGVGADGGSYNVLQLRETPGEVGFTFMLANDTHTYTPTVATWPGGSGNAANIGVFHMQISNAADHNTLRFAPGYFAPGTGVVGNTWDDSDSGFASVIFTPGMVYTFRSFNDPPWIYYVLLDATGNVVARQLSTMADVGSVVGPWLFLQTFNAGITYKSVWARKRSKNSLSIREFLGGLDSTPIGVRSPAPARFTSIHASSGELSEVHIGDSTSSGVFSMQYNAAAGPQHPTITADGGAGTLEVKATALGNVTFLATNFWGAQAFVQIDGNGTMGLRTLINGVDDTWLGKKPSKSPFLMTLPQAANDTEAANLTPPVEIGELYRNGSVVMQRQS